MRAVLLAPLLALPASAGEFLRLAPDARGAALGEAAAAAADDASALHWNPAGLARVRSASTVLSRAEHVAGTSLNFAAHALPAAGGTAGVSIAHFGAGPISGTDASGADSGSFSPYDLALSAGYARRVADELSAGAAVKFVQSRIVATARTTAADLGASYEPGDGARIAASIANLGGRLRFESESEPLPLVARLGGALESESWLVSLEGVHARRARPSAAAGAEWRAPADGGWGFAARGGFNTRALGELSGPAGVSFGFGVSRGAFRADYAVAPFGGLGLSHRLTLVFGLGREPEPRRRWER